MVLKKQNLFLFFEENEFEFEITSDLVRLAMIRFIVDEDAQFEIIGTYNLRKCKPEMINIEHPDYKKFAKERTEKEAFDKYLISEAVDKALLYQTTSSDAHFIIGSGFHLLNCKYAVGIRTSLFDWISSEIKDIGLQSLYCTIYSGSRAYLITKELSDACYDGKIFRAKYSEQKQSNLPQATYIRQMNFIFNNMKSSINNDLEDFLLQIRSGYRPSMNLSSKLVMLYLHKMLTISEFKEVQNIDSQFWNSIVGGRRVLYNPETPVCEPKVSYKDLMMIYKPKFIFCFGRRLTVLLK